MESSTTDVLPDEIWLRIFSFVDGKLLLSKVALVCGHWRSLTEDEELWELQVRRILADRPLSVTLPPPASAALDEQAREAMNEAELRRAKLVEDAWRKLKAKVETWVKPKGRTWKWLYQAKTNVFTEVKEGTSPTGIGCCIWTSNGTDVHYEGEWKDGRGHGVGIKLLRGEGREWLCMGEFGEDWVSGEASAVWTSPVVVVYEGHWVDDKPHGYGVMHNPIDGEYAGEWVVGQETGRGKHSWMDGSYYEGDWVAGGQEGFGTYVWRSGNFFTGEWKACRQVRGTYSWFDGRTYEGEYQENKHGQGTYLWPDGAKYTGEWDTGLRHGRGRMDWPDGSYFLGKWHQDDREEAEETNVEDWRKPNRRYDLYFLEDGQVWDDKYAADIQERRRQRKLALEEEKLRVKLQQLQLAAHEKAN